MTNTDYSSDAGGWRARVWAEAMIMGRFGLVGATATATHMCVVWLLIMATSFPILVANSIAFLTAFGISFIGNYHWTFQSPGNPGKAVARFFLISAGAFAINTVILAALLHSEWLDPEIAAVASATVIPIITFIASRLWGFRPSSTDGAGRLPLPSPAITGTQRIGVLMLSGKSRLPRHLDVLTPLFLGIAGFVIVVGTRVLDPRNIAWLGDGDPATHYLGWIFFRNSEWSFPVGLNPRYGLELGNAILYSDSNPLLAILFKPFSTLLPEPFQYFGFWILGCFVLQAWFAWKIVGLISGNPVIRFLAAGFFVFSPPMIWRLQGHLSLVGHFLILAALYLALCPALNRRMIVWGTLLSVTALVHAYLLAMVGAIWLADLVGRTVSRERALRKSLVELMVLLAVVGSSCWQAGYFSVGDNVTTDGYGFYRMNLLSIIDPSGWSYILKDLPEGKGDYEGFNFLGLGVILLLVCSIPAVCEGRVKLISEIRNKPVLVVLLLALSVFALSNKIGIGPFEIKVPLHWRLEDILLRSAGIFRSSGRMFWPVFYMLLITVIVIIVKSNNKRAATYLLALALALQIADTSAHWRHIRERLTVEPSATWVTPLHDLFWAQAATTYKNVRLIQPGNNRLSWLAFAAYAGEHGLGTDAVYLARVAESSAKELRSKAAKSVSTGQYDSDSLYILDDEVVREAVLTIDSDVDLLARVDGFNVLAPGWKKCLGCKHVDNELRLP